MSADYTPPRPVRGWFPGDEDGPGHTQRPDAPTCCCAEQVWCEYEKGVGFKQQLNLYETVKVNEDFFVGKQWEGVQSNGLPTPVFNYIRRIVLYLVASTATDNLKMNATPLSGVQQDRAERLCKVVNAQFEELFERNKMGMLIRQFMRNAAVDGDACLYAWFDPEVETGQAARGAVRTELLDNTRVIFGNPNSRQVQEQPWIIVSRRERLDDVRRETAEYGGDPDQVRAETDEIGDRFDAMTDGKVTTLLKLWRDARSGTIRAVKTVQGALVRPEWDTGQCRYPLVWMSWDQVPNCYHGQAAVTGLIPNQIFVNKMFAMTMISLMTTAYPKVVYDKTRIARWDSGVGKAIGVNLGGGSVADVAKTIDPAVISPQVSQFIDLAISMTKEVMGATDAALGSVRPDNTSAILALQKASQVPIELTKQDLYQCIEDLGRIWLDLMQVYYGQRFVRAEHTDRERQTLGAVQPQSGLPGETAPLGFSGDTAAPLGFSGETGMPFSGETVMPFDFSALNQAALTLKLDVGGSAYWSEIAQMNTLDNLLTQGKINIIDYLERVPNGYISNQQELIDTLRERESAAAAPTQAQSAAAVTAAGM